MAVLNLLPFPFQIYIRRCDNAVKSNPKIWKQAVRVSVRYSTVGYSLGFRPRMHDTCTPFIRGRKTALRSNYTAVRGTKTPHPPWETPPHILEIP